MTDGTDLDHKFCLTEKSNKVLEKKSIDKELYVVHTRSLYFLLP